MAKKDYTNWDRNELIKEIDQLRKRKKYGLVWEDKLENVVEQCKTELPVLEEVKNKQITTDLETPVNLLIEGDNYHALSVLNYTHKGKIDVIYIDPPYNTGNKDFIYNDDYVDSEDSFRHSKWLSFMSKRLELAKNLLSKDGVMFISIDNNEVAQLKMLCDGIMPNGFVTTLHVQMSTVQGQKVKAAKTGNIVKNGEYILVYSKSGNKNIGKRVLYEPTEYDTHYSGYLIKNNNNSFKEIGLENVLAEKFKDELEAMGLLLKNSLPKSKIKEAYQLSNIIRDFIHENSKSIVRRDRPVPVETTSEQEKLMDNGFVLEFKKNNREYLIAKDKNGNYTQVFRLSHKIKQCHDFYNTYGISTIRGDWWPGFYLDMGNVSKEGGIKFENGKKPIRLMKQLIYFTAKKNSTILDFFAGSGSTGHSVIDLNQDKENFNLKFILCTYNEENGNGRIVDEFCYPRLNSIIKGNDKVKGMGGNLKYFKTSFVPADQTDKNKITLTEKAIEMLCVKEDTFEEVKSTKQYKIFRNKKRYTGIIFDHQAIDDLKKEIAKIEGKFSLYIFSLGDDTFDEEFENMKKKVKLSPIPEAILRVYRRIFK